MQKQQHYFNAEPNANHNYDRNLNPILTATPTNPNPNHSLTAGGTAFLRPVRIARNAD